MRTKCLTENLKGRDHSEDLGKDNAYFTKTN